MNRAQQPHPILRKTIKQRLRDTLGLDKIPAAYEPYYRQMMYEATNSPSQKAFAARQKEMMLQKEMNKHMPHGHHYGQDGRLYIHPPPIVVEPEAEHQETIIIEPQIEIPGTFKSDERDDDTITRNEMTSLLSVLCAWIIGYWYLWTNELYVGGRA